jgi:predicted dehydrogenase
MSVSIAIIGAGNISKAHLSAAAALKGTVTIGAVVEPQAEKRKAALAQTGAKGFESPEQFFASNPKSIVAGVMVCTPPNVRLNPVGKSLQLGLGVFVEKPIASKLSDAQALLGMSYQYRMVPTMVGYCHRFVPAVIEMKKRADAGELGSLIRFENTFASWLPGMEQSWMSDPAVSGGGSFIDTGCHSLDLFRYLVGDGAIISSHYQELWKGRGETAATVLVRAAKTAKHNKVVGQIQSGWMEPGRFTLSITGTKGSLSYDYDAPTQLIHTPSEGPRQTISVESHELRFERQLQAFAQILQGQPPSTKPASFDDATQVAKLVDEAGRGKAII